MAASVPLSVDERFQFLVVEIISYDLDIKPIAYSSTKCGSKFLASEKNWNNAEFKHNLWIGEMAGIVVLLATNSLLNSGAESAR